MPIHIDTNIAIYISNGTLSADILKGQSVGFASIVSIESLGYHELLTSEAHLIEQILAIGDSLPLTDSVIRRAIQLRQLRRLSLGDAIIAATAIEYDTELWTANTKDFSNINGLKIHNPLET